MRVVYKQCAGLDVHKKTVVACRVRINEEGQREQEVRTFGTMTCELLLLLAWGVTHVAMESTGEYWKPVYNLLEGQVTVLLVNAQHVKHVPGRKTAPRDSLVFVKPQMGGNQDSIEIGERKESKPKPGVCEQRQRVQLFLLYRGQADDDKKYGADCCR